MTKKKLQSEEQVFGQAASDLFPADGEANSQRRCSGIARQSEIVGISHCRNIQQQGLKTINQQSANSAEQH